MLLSSDLPEHDCVEFPDSKCVQSTKGAILVQLSEPDMNPVWIPRNCLGYRNQVWSKSWKRRILVVQRWFAEQAGLVNGDKD